MRTYDFSPLYRSTVGFDRLARLLEQATDVQQFDSWPPYDIQRTGENEYRVEMAVAGFAPQDIEMTQEGGKLVVIGKKQPADGKGEYLHRGIAWRPFKQTFSLADRVEVSSASLINGVLKIDLQREIPEALRPRKIAIGSSQAPEVSRTIEHEQQPEAA
ncbi:MAG: ibpA [Hyphomicrobiales bacterium]|nr:ibpA [Hyphomicrobiales bacterium]